MHDSNETNCVHIPHFLEHQEEAMTDFEVEAREGRIAY